MVSLEKLHPRIVFATLILRKFRSFTFYFEKKLIFLDLSTNPTNS